MIEEIKKVLNKQKKDKGKKGGVKINIFGTTGSGKTYKAIKITEKCFKTAFVYRMTDDFDKVKNVVILSPRNFILDLDPFIKKVIEYGKKKVIDAVIFDEADMLFPSNKPLTPLQKELFDKHRHYNLSILCISRRPQNINTFITEEAHFTAVLSLEGENAINKFNAVYKGWGDMIRQLEYKSYNYVFKELGKAPVFYDRNDKRIN